jgi:hypothetical protein
MNVFIVRAATSARDHARPEPVTVSRRRFAPKRPPHGYQPATCASFPVQWKVTTGRERSGNRGCRDFSKSRASTAPSMEIGQHCEASWPVAPDSSSPHVVRLCY